MFLSNILDKIVMFLSNILDKTAVFLSNILDKMMIFPLIDVPYTMRKPLLCARLRRRSVRLRASAW